MRERGEMSGEGEGRRDGDDETRKLREKREESMAAEGKRGKGS